MADNATIFAGEREERDKFYNKLWQEIEKRISGEERRKEND